MGNGENIDIWTNPWVPNPSGGIFRIYGAQPIHSPTKFSQLLLPNSISWNSNLINQLFPKIIAQEIPNIYISHLNPLPTLTCPPPIKRHLLN